ncbi:transcriptional regulator with XRE-family HTH domain [Bradyrhizobium sp. GM2.2]|uniref:hypothetical protein n=1 Tax=Bradyrhizobium sp. GM2.2 TaxID=3156358 RepID=UPI003397F6C4
MNARLRGYVSTYLFVCTAGDGAQWLSQLPQDQREQPTINVLRQAFESYYREDPVELKLDKLEPTFRFERVQEEKERLDVEEYKLFRRWEWLVEPRAYPSGRLDLEERNEKRRWRTCIHTG